MSENDHFTRDDDSRFTLRIPAQLLKEEAKKNKRSTGRQIEFILEKWVSKNSPRE